MIQIRRAIKREDELLVKEENTSSLLRVFSLVSCVFSLFPMQRILLSSPFFGAAHPNTLITLPFDLLHSHSVSSSNACYSQPPWISWRWSLNLPQILTDVGMMAKDHMIWLQRAEFMADKPGLVKGGASVVNGGG
jgi:hypothetical protein